MLVNSFAISTNESWKYKNRRCVVDIAILRQEYNKNRDLIRNLALKEVG